MKHIFFDLDGTLVDSSLGIKNSFAYAMEKMKVEHPGDQIFDTFIGPPLEVSFKSIVGEKRVEEAIRFYREYYKEDGVFQAHLYSGIPELLQELRNEGYFLYVTTSKNEPMAVKMLEYLKIKDDFDGIFGALPDSYHKADVLHRALNTFQVPTEESVILGDTLFDMIGGVKVGIHTLGVLWGFGTKEDLLANGAETLITTPQETLAALKKF